MPTGGWMRQSPLSFPMAAKPSSLCTPSGPTGREPSSSTAKATGSRCTPISLWGFVASVSIRRSLFIGALPVALSVWAAETSQWFLAGQEGKCIPLSTLAKKGPEFQDIKSPYQLVEKMRAAGHKAEIKEHKAGTRPAVEVRVPSKDLYVMFVEASACAPDQSGKK